MFALADASLMAVQEPSDDSEKKRYHDCGGSLSLDDNTLEV